MMSTRVYSSLFEQTAPRVPLAFHGARPIHPAALAALAPNYRTIKIQSSAQVYVNRLPWGVKPPFGVAPHGQDVTPAHNGPGSW